MIEEKLVDSIRACGTVKDLSERRSRILTEELKFRTGKKAEYVLVTGCFPPVDMPHALLALKNLLDHFKVDYTLLPKEYCCGWMIGKSAVTAKNEEDIARAKQLSGELVRENFRQAEALGARSIVLFCAACEPNYTSYAGDTKLEIISYSELLDRFFQGGRLEAEVDYYPGCYRFRRRITSEPVNVTAGEKLLDKIKGLKVHHLNDNLCCYVQPHLEQLTGSLSTKNVVTVCTGCHKTLRNRLPGADGYAVKMMPEVVWEAVRQA